MKWLGTILALIGAAHSVPALSNPAASFTNLEPLAALIAEANARDIAISGIELSSASAGTRQGDSVTLLLELSDPGRRRQWLATLQTDELTPSERKRRPPIADLVRYTTTGGELRYRTAADAALRLRIIGPFSEGTNTMVAASEKDDRVVVSSEFLGFGLDEACWIWLRIQANLKRLHAAEPVTLWRTLHLEASGRRYPDRVVKQSRAAAAEINFTADDERPFYGLELALESFIRVVESSPAASQILDQVVEKPSWWSTVTHLGVEGEFIAAPGQIALLAPNPPGITSAAYRLPFEVSLNGQPALIGELAVTAPRPPLLACAGILGVSASPPHGPAKLLRVRLLAGRRGAGPMIAPESTIAP